MNWKDDGAQTGGMVLNPYELPLSREAGVQLPASEPFPERWQPGTVATAVCSTLDSSKPGVPAGYLTNFSCERTSRSAGIYLRRNVGTSKQPASCVK